MHIQHFAVILANKHSNALRRVYRVPWPLKHPCLYLKCCNSMPMLIRLVHPYLWCCEPLQRPQMSLPRSTASRQWSLYASLTILPITSIYPCAVISYTERSSSRVMQPAKVPQVPNGEAMSTAVTRKSDLRRAREEPDLATRRAPC